MTLRTRLAFASTEIGHNTLCFPCTSAPETARKRQRTLLPFAIFIYIDQNFALSVVLFSTLASLALGNFVDITTPTDHPDMLKRTTFVFLVGCLINKIGDRLATD